MNDTTIWTHGNALVVEDPVLYSSIYHHGWGTELRFGLPRDDEDQVEPPLRYCHVPLQTPPAVDGKAPILTKLTVLYETTGYWQIQRIDIWDGNDPAGQIDQSIQPPPVLNGEARGHGSHLTPDVVNQLAVIPPRQVTTAISVSFACALIFLPENDPPVQDTDPKTLTVVAIGAEYAYPLSISELPGARAKTVAHLPPGIIKPGK